jgi:hypothetical protein
MNEAFRILILREIEWQWKSFKNEMRPNGVWIAEYGPVPLDFYNIFCQKPPERVYFLDKTGISETDAAEFQKFTNFSETPIRYKNDRTFEIGMAMFAEYQTSENFFYFCYQFGGRFGKGYRIKFNEAGETIKYEDIWVS